MPDQLTITCPHCSFSKTVPKSAIPDGAHQATCPGCKKPFPLNAQNMRFQAPPTPPSYAASLASAAAETQRQPHRRCTLGFAFNGSAREYFGIWIVNSLLKIVTIGFYSAWAKVRRRRFFYGSTSLQGEPFDYLADPIPLFKGWLVAAGAFILYTISTNVSPLLSIAIAVLVFIAFPWLLVRSRIFNAVNSSYRNIRFGFRPQYREAYVVFAGLPILTALSLGILTPYMFYRQKKFIVENSTYGATPFSFSATAKDFYLLSAKVALGFVLVVGMLAVCIWLSGAGQAFTGSADDVGAAGVLVLLSLFFLLVLYFILMVYGQTALSNLCWNNTQVGNDRFRSSLCTKDMALLFITNAVAILCSFGLLMPWATVRMARYRFEQLKLESNNGLEDILSAANGGQAVSATGEEIGDLFDLPIDIAL